MSSLLMEYAFCIFDHSPAIKHQHVMNKYAESNRSQVKQKAVRT